MLFWIAILSAIVAGYLLGATPTAYLAGRWLKGIDIRQHGSKSVGATNALRTLGVGPGLVVLVIDLLKGVAAVLLARWICATFPPPAALDVAAWTPWIVALAGLAALLGHSRSIWLGFTGGKSAATGLGVLLAIAWPVGVGAAAVVVAVLAVSRIMSLGSMLGALSAMILVCMLDQPPAFRLLVLAGGAYVIVRHRGNIGRLLSGTEPRIGQRATPG